MERKQLKKIHHPSVIPTLSLKQMKQLCKELRLEIVETMGKNGGHLSSNLGTVELTTALLHTFTPPVDNIIWDVGHQSYSYKLLTGRRGQFSTIRQKDGLSGYPKTTESPYDSFVAGHSSTSIAAAYGIACGKRVGGKEGHTIAVIGDGAMTGGLAYEAINNVGENRRPFILIVNDNALSISKSEGALASYLATLRNSPEYFKLKSATNKTLRSIPYVGSSIRDGLAEMKYGVKQVMYPSTFFEQFGFDYMGPVDGHDLKSLCAVLEEAKHTSRPVLIHVKTIKGKGYHFAEEHPEAYHGVSPFNPVEGVQLNQEKMDFSHAFGQFLLEEGEKDSSIVAITAAMENSTGLTPFKQRFGGEGRFFDVGIAEAFATTFSGGLSATGMKPVFAVYSTFLQRGYDQIIHDCSIEPRQVLFAIDRAGLVGSDGETHQGVFDVSFLSHIPHTTIYAPATYEELGKMLHKGLHEPHEGVVAVRYPRGGEPKFTPKQQEELSPNHENWTYIPPKEEGKGILITYGSLTAQCMAVRDSTGCGVCKLGRIHPLPEDLIPTLSQHQQLYFAEEGMYGGGIAMQLGLALLEEGYKGQYKVRAIKDFVPQGSVTEQLEALGLTGEKLIQWISEE